MSSRSRRGDEGEKSRKSEKNQRNSFLTVYRRVNCSDTQFSMGTSSAKKQRKNQTASHARERRGLGIHAGYPTRWKVGR